MSDQEHELSQLQNLLAQASAQDASLQIQLRAMETKVQKLRGLQAFVRQQKSYLTKAELATAHKIRAKHQNNLDLNAVHSGGITKSHGPGTGLLLQHKSLAQNPNSSTNNGHNCGLVPYRSYSAPVQQQLKVQLQSTVAPAPTTVSLAERRDYVLTQLEDPQQ